MNKYFLSLALVLCIGNAFGQDTQIHDDVNLMFEHINKFFNQYSDRIQTLQENSSLTPANEAETHDFVIWHGLFLIAMFRLNQQVACLIEKETAQEQVAMIWQALYPVFTLFEPSVYVDGINEALEWIQEHGNEAWTPTDSPEAYIPEASWAEARAQVTQGYSALLLELRRAAETFAAQ